MGIIRSLIRGAERRAIRGRGSSVKGSGFEVVFNRIPEVIAEVEANAQKTVARIARDMAEDARSRAPVRTGHLRDSIDAKASGKSAEFVAAASYAGFVEFGTYRTPAQPFMSPAIEAYKSEFFDPKNYFPRGSI
jgi:HK97 gp10 family phage protein